MAVTRLTATHRRVRSYARVALDVTPLWILIIITHHRRVLGYRVAMCFLSVALYSLLALWALQG